MAQNAPVEPVFGDLRKVSTETVFGDLRRVPTEHAYTIVAELRDSIEFDHDSLGIWYGEHPKMGNVYVVISPFEDAVILPFVIRRET
jgi:hypothetical protein